MKAATVVLVWALAAVAHATRRETTPRTTTTRAPVGLSLGRVIDAKDFRKGNQGEVKLKASNKGFYLVPASKGLIAQASNARR